MAEVKETEHLHSFDRKHRNSLSIVSFNMSLGYEFKLPQILKHCHSRKIPIVCLQETGILSQNPAVISKQMSKHYKVFPCFNESTCNKHHTTAICVHASLKHNVSKVMHHSSGRLMAIELTFKASQSILLMNVYMPTGLDNASETSSEFKKLLTQLETGNVLPIIEFYAVILTKH